MAGYPTPDNPIGDMAYICKPIFIPDDEAFAACLYGQLAEMTNNWYWVKEGTMTPQDAAFYMAVAMGMNDVDAEGCGMTCEQIIDCIENDPATQTAITNYIQTTGIGDPNFGSPDIPMMDTRFPLSAREGEIAPPPAGCDNDVLWAGIREMVARLDDNGRDFLEDLQVIVDRAERVSGLIELIPIVGSVASAVIDQFTETIPDVLNLYDSYSSEAVMDDIACALFELVCNECRYPTFEEVIDYYANLGTAGLGDYVNLTVAASMTNAAALIGFSNFVVYHSIITFQLYFMFLGAKFNLANDQSSLGLWASLGEDFPSDNWIALCNGCAPSEWCHEWTGSQLPADWVIEYNSVNFSARGSEFVDDLLIPQARTAQSIKLNLGGSVEIIEVEAETIWDVTMNANLTFPLSFNTTLPNSVVIERWTKANFGNPTVYPFQATRTWNGSITCEEFRVFSGSNTGSHPTETGATIRIKVKGTGAKPNFVGGTAC